MGIQSRYERMPLPPEKTAPRYSHMVVCDRDYRRSEARFRREERAHVADMSGAGLIGYLDLHRQYVAESYIFTVNYRMAIHEAVVVRHWTLIWDAVLNRHHVH